MDYSVYSWNHRIRLTGVSIVWATAKSACLAFGTQTNSLGRFMDTGCKDPRTIAER